MPAFFDVVAQRIRTGVLEAPLGASTLLHACECRGGNGLDGWGGDILIGTEGDITVASTSRIEADSTGTNASDGTITLSACDITIAGDIDTRSGDVFGYSDFIYAGTFTQNNGSALWADDALGNDVFCRCIDTSPANGVCDAPAACVSNPTLNGSATPSVTLVPMSMASCS